MLSYQVVEWGAPLEPRSFATPEPAGTEVLVRVEACGVCHSDLHIWSGGFDLGGGNRALLEARGVRLPLTMGHEPVGVVEAVGPEAEGVAVGERRIVFPWIGCRRCAACARGDDNLCATPQFIGARVDGGYSDHVLVPHPKYLVDYSGVPRDLAATYACSGITAYGALKKLGELDAADSVLLIGAGGVGLNGLQLAPSVTPARVLVADVDPAKRAAARQAGAHDTVDNADPRAVTTLREMSHGGIAAAIDFVGRPETFQLGMDVLRKGGTLVVVGLYGGACTVPVPMFPFTAMSVRGSYVGTLAEMHELMAVVRAGGVAPIPIERRPLAEANQALRDLQQGRVLGRLVLEP
ncbi:MAG: alcohol dehydrogenase catalytic domain-containing protein [Ectothiorhodospiraceae bacterium]|nr:alcohol dehydrogenase catalytic domain-containing protein [Ectothiorhodospiraceae bacterium]